MMKRLILPGCLFFILCICIGVFAPANAQDTTKKVEPEKKAEPEKKPVIKTAIPPKTKPVYHNHKVNPAGVPAAPVNNDSASLKAQIDPTQLNDKSLKGQYQYLLTKVYHYQQPLVVALWKNVTDTLNLQRSLMKDLQTRLVIKSHTLDSLKADMTARKDQTFSELTNKIDSISLFGLAMSKATYNLVMFGLVFGLAIALTVVILTTAKYKYDAKHHIELHEELEEEFKVFKAKATEKELKLARELQTERNKLDELLGRG
jgi:hypothetical protein